MTAPAAKASAPAAKASAPVEKSSAPVEKLSAPVAKASAPVAKSSAPATKAAAPARTISTGELEQLVRQEAFNLAKRRQFRGGSQVKDWFAAEATVKAQLSARGIALAS